MDLWRVMARILAPRTGLRARMARLGAFQFSYPFIQEDPLPTNERRNRALLDVAVRLSGGAVRISALPS